MIDLTGARWRKSNRSNTVGSQCVEVAAVWRKSSRSNSQAGQCVEVAAVWRKSQRSNTAGGHCVELAGAGRAVAVRDSKNPDGPALAFARSGWSAFAGRTKRGGYDR